MAKFPRRPAAAASARPRKPARPARKPRDAYHHGHLRQALVDQAVATIRERGVETLTLRHVGERLRVSRTALYRHFADKEALLAAVATEGFRTFRHELAKAWDDTGHTREGFIAQGHAYVAFAMANPSHYRVMFGGFVAKADCDPALRTTAGAAFAVLVDAIAELQAQGRIRAGDPQVLAIFAWSAVHGLAMLVIDGQLARPGASPDAAIAASIDRVWDGLAETRQGGPST
jgi:AcrR family transcriptional regulator